jgi:hypothetical protein
MASRTHQSEAPKTSVALTIEQAAGLMNVGIRSANEEREAGRLKMVKVAGRWLTSVPYIESWIDNRIKEA